MGYPTDEEFRQAHREGWPRGTLMGEPLKKKKRKPKKRAKQIMPLAEIAENEELLEIGRKAVEGALVDYRDSRISVIGRNNGLIIREYNGQPSSVVRFGPETALRIGLKAINAELVKRKRA